MLQIFAHDGSTVDLLIPGPKSTFSADQIPSDPLTDQIINSKRGNYLLLA